MIQAMKAVRDGTLSANVAAKTFGTPPSTLKDRISGRVKHRTKSDPTPYLDDGEEIELLNYLKEVSCHEMWQDQQREIYLG